MPESTEQSGGEYHYPDPPEKSHDLEGHDEEPADYRTHPESTEPASESHSWRGGGDYRGGREAGGAGGPKNQA